MTERLDTGTWLDIHAGEMQDQLKHFYGVRIAYFTEAERKKYAPLYNLETRTFSEMPLCEGHFSIFWEVGHPYGYRVIRGCTDTSGVLGKRSKGIPHVFMLDHKSKRVLDVTAAQFVEPRVAAGKGERSAALASIAPDMVRTFSSGLTVLNGTVDEIEGRLGIKYYDTQLRQEA